jgi:polyhydroxyalkanoate synthesis regulator phasin
MLNPTKIMAATAALVVAGAMALGVARYASAQEPGATPSGPKARVEAFLGKVAANLGVSSDQLTSAVKDAELQTVDERVADGTLTSDQAAKIKDRINNSQGTGLGALVIGRHEMRERARLGIVRASAQAIGIAPKDLVTELKDGKSIADVAAEHNVPLDAVKSQITDGAKARLDQAVQDGKITQEQEDRALQKLADNLDAILNHSRSADSQG